MATTADLAVRLGLVEEMLAALFARFPVPTDLAIRPRGGEEGRALVIWGCKAHLQLSRPHIISGCPKDRYLGRIQALVKHLQGKEQWSPSREVWYGGPVNSTEEQCLRLAVD